MARWYRSREDRVLAGVCGAVSRQTGLPIVLVRALFLVLALVHGLGVLLYVMAALFLPEEGSQADRFRQVVGDNASSLSRLFAEFWGMLFDWWGGWRERRRWGASRERARELLGLLLVVGAAVVFLSSFGFLDWLTFPRFVALCALGLGVLLLRRSNSHRS